MYFDSFLGCGISNIGMEILFVQWWVVDSLQRSEKRV